MSKTPKIGRFHPSTHLPRRVRVHTHQFASTAPRRVRDFTHHSNVATNRTRRAVRASTHPTSPAPAVLPEANLRFDLGGSGAAHAKHGLLNASTKASISNRITLFKDLIFELTRRLSVARSILCADFHRCEERLPVLKLRK